MPLEEINEMHIEYAIPLHNELIREVHREHLWKVIASLAPNYKEKDRKDLCDSLEEMTAHPSRLSVRKAFFNRGIELARQERKRKQQCQST